MPGLQTSGGRGEAPQIPDDGVGSGWALDWRRKVGCFTGRRELRKLGPLRLKAGPLHPAPPFQSDFPIHSLAASAEVGRRRAERRERKLREGKEAGRRFGEIGVHGVQTMARQAPGTAETHTLIRQDFRASPRSPGLFT